MRLTKQTARGAARALLAAFLVAAAAMQGAAAIAPAWAQAQAPVAPAPAAPPPATNAPTPSSVPSAQPAAKPSAQPAANPTSPPAQAVAPGGAAPAQPGTAPAEAAAPRPAAPPDQMVVAAREKIEKARASLDALDAALQVEGLRPSDLDDLRVRLDPIRREVAGRLEELSPRLADTKSRLAALGKAPGENDPPEDPAVTADRERLERLKAELDGGVKQLVGLNAHIDQISDRISARRRALFTSQLFERSQSVLDPTLWTDAASGIAREMRALNYLVMDWSGYAGRHQTPVARIAILAGAAAIAAAVLALGRLLRRHMRIAPPEDGAELTRLRAARTSLKIVLVEAAAAPLAAVAAVSFLHAFDMIPPRAAELVRGFVVAVFIQAIGRAVANGLLAPDAAWRRLPNMSDRWARVAFRYTSLAVWTLAVATFLNALHRVLFVPLALTVTTSAMMTLLIAIFTARFLVRLAGDDEDEDEENQGKQWLKVVVWLALAVLVGALLTGYVSFAAFLAARMVVAAAVLGAYYLLSSLIDGFFAEGLSADTRRAHATSKMLGLKQSSLELIGVIIAGVLKVLLFIIAAVLIAGSWGTSTADVMDTVERATFGLQIGSINVTFAGVLNAVVVLGITLAIARTLQRWIAGSILPRTQLEASLQSSIATIAGYVGYITAIMVSMGQMGLNLENIALVAGALSVGIGLGLQSIVSNFVSGLILLTERPVRVGDTIAVKGEEGYVRRISVRSTEIETFDRASVIVPNSDLISGVVKNWTHTNTTGRLIITVHVTYDADPEEVRDILVACASSNPQVLKSPPARVFLSKMLETGMVFELRCVVANVDYSLSVNSDLNFAILKRFRAAGISLATQSWAANGPHPAPPPEPAPEPVAEPAPDPAAPAKAPAGTAAPAPAAAARSGA